MDRRSFLHQLAALGAFGALAAACRAAAPASAAARTLAGELRLWSWFDLPNDPRSRELSGIAWDEREGVLWAVQDARASIVSLRPDRELRRWRFGRSIPLQIEGELDLEGLVLLPDGFLVCSEIGPRIVEVDREGRFRRELPVPEHFRDAPPNRSLESLTLAPSRRFAFTTSESTLTRDGAEATPDRGARVRILRMTVDPARPAVTGPRAEYVYETDPAPFAGGDWGVADLAAIDDDDLLVLERGWRRGYGNVVRIYQVHLDTAATCAGVERLDGSMRVLAKALRLDLATLPTEGLPTPQQPQPSPLLDNFEGLAIGPHLPDGGPTLLLASDDNGHATQVARILVLACS